MLNRFISIPVFFDQMHPFNAIAVFGNKDDGLQRIHYPSNVLLGHKP